MYEYQSFIEASMPKRVNKFFYARMKYPKWWSNRSRELALIYTNTRLSQALMYYTANKGLPKYEVQIYMDFATPKRINRFKERHWCPPDWWTDRDRELREMYIHTRMMPIA